MKVNIFITLCMTLCQFCFGQNEIVYKLPIKVNEIILQKIKQDSSDNSKYLYYSEVYSQLDTHEVVIRIMNLNDVPLNKELTELIKKSNRFIKIENSKIPIIFNTDYHFSSEVNKFHPDGSVSTIGFSGGAFTITFAGRFDSNCRIINYSKFE